MNVFVARQPIFDEQQKVYAYELLFRSGWDNFYDQSDGDYASSSVLSHSFLLIGLDSLTRGKRAFINFTRNLLLNEVATIFPKELMAIEILENIEPDDEIIAACKKLKQFGYLLVLDDFVFKVNYKPLVELADIIKVDFLNTKFEERLTIIQRVGSSKIKFLAEKLESRETFEQALELGFSYFQGYFFCKPDVISSHDVPAYKLNYLRLLSEINRPEVNYDKLEKIFKRDLTLSYKLLNYINSAHFGFWNKIRSIKHALALLGLVESKKWLSLIALSCIGKDKPDELVVSSIVRAYFCELIAPKIGLKDRASELFLMGLFSMLDSFLDQPMAEVLDRLPISIEIKNALLGKKSHFRDVLDLILSYEKGHWKQFSEYAAKLKVEEPDIPEFFLKAIEWAQQIFPQKG